MPASWPTSVKTFSTHDDNTDTIFAAHVNALQDEVNALETSLGVGVKGGFGDVHARITDIETNKSTVGHSHDHGALTGLSDDDHPQYQLRSLFTAQGDIAYATSSGNWARLGKGTAGQVLKINTGATAPEWGDASAGEAGDSDQVVLGSQVFA